MFRDRAAQFVDRLKWSALSVDSRGWERDEYDALDPLYVVWELDDGNHGASMRLLPMDGPNMIHDHFGNVVQRHSHRSADIWECSRFVVSENANSSAVSALFVAAGEFFLRDYAKAFVGLFDRRMLRVYKMMKNFPEIIGATDGTEDWVAAGVWKMSIPVWERSMTRLGITKCVSQSWFEESEQCSQLRFTSASKQAA
jgi:acyl homoserine lactone synthase